jgi:hypothetical protein
MTIHDHHSHHDHHHRHPGQAHPPAAVHPSLLRLSAAQRLGIAGAAIVLMWLLVLWAGG